MKLKVWYKTHAPFEIYDDADFEVIDNVVYVFKIYHIHTFGGLIPTKENIACINLDEVIKIKKVKDDR